MVQSNKILTVSYGTFSCTLEGFDDAFGTMKAIAEYFRDLAAEDRYFGAEPPQPDADMLAHIAQQEVARRVEAHRDDNGIVLRAQDMAAPAALTQSAAAVQPVETEAVPARTTETPQDRTVADIATTVAAQTVAETVIEPVAEAEAAAFFEGDAAEAGTTPEAAATDEAVTQSDIGAAEAVTDIPADPAPEDIAEPVAEEMPEPAATTAADSIAAKLQRIRAVVSQSGTVAKTQDFTEDEHAEPLIGADVSEDISSLIASVQTEDEPEDAAQVDFSDVEDDLSAHLDALEDLPRADTPAPQEAAPETPVEDAQTPAITDPQPDTADEAEPQPRAQARVVKVSREEFDALLAADRGEDMPETAATESSLSAEQEADLLRELAEVEAEVHGTEDDRIESIFAETSEDDSGDADDDFAEERAILSGDAEAEAEGDPDPVVSRIMEQADERLNDPETSDRRSEFAHLRAAMAAGKAEEDAGGSITQEHSDGVYREDLARVVRPRRPATAEVRSRRPQDDKPAPLKLVAAQRVDADQTPVQPRRVMSTPAEEIQEDGTDGKMKFADYASGVGAVDLPDLLEAAAAYLSFVEGQEHFSRPQLMTKVRTVGQEGFSREDGLRSFGLLLRDGKIEKTQAGRFTVSDRIGFRPEDMRAAG
ncbi:hypothetical protein [Aestuariivita sp.]|uniref:hypothetical protein n=1 Tax=Aestuariivita sp. TaxID=1872407 RepID=UPI00216DF8A4|nr:hypothetical protein [Aestuariivita sp.]MCE8007941.1 hypothetical protein [Aestuariivita sp.]